MGHQRQRKSKPQNAQKRRKGVAESDELQSAESRDSFGLSPNGILNLQHTIGNQAVQRLIVQRDLGDSGGIQADSGKDRPQGKETRYVAFVSITLADQGKVKGESSIKGHEGKMEVHLFTMSHDEQRGYELGFTRISDSATVVLLQAAASGETVTSAQLEVFRRQENGALVPVYSYDCTDGLIGTFQHVNNPSDNQPAEYLQLQFKKAEMK